MFSKLATLAATHRGATIGLYILLALCGLVLAATIIGTSCASSPESTLRTRPGASSTYWLRSVRSNLASPSPRAVLTMRMRPTARELTTLLRETNTLLESAALDARLDRIDRDVEALVDRLFWRALLVVAALVLGLAGIRLIPSRTAPR